MHLGKDIKRQKEREGGKTERCRGREGGGVRGEGGKRERRRRKE